jgi:hypothetical protein
MVAFQELFDDCAFTAFENQMRLHLLVGDQDWSLDAEAATLTFGGGVTLPVQFLGTDSEVSNTWLWADANRKASLPDHALQLCHTAREAGCKLGLEEFGSDHFAFLDEVGKPNGYTLVMVATCLGRASCFYRCPHENGAVFVAICDPRVDEQPDLDREGFVQAFNNLLWQPGDMRRRIVSYLSAKGYIGKDFAGTDLKCALHTGEQIELSFKPTKGGRMKVEFGAQRRARKQVVRE